MELDIHNIPKTWRLDDQGTVYCSRGHKVTNENYRYHMRIHRKQEKRGLVTYRYNVHVRKLCGNRDRMVYRYRKRMQANQTSRSNRP